MLCIAEAANIICPPYCQNKPEQDLLFYIGKPNWTGPHGAKPALALAEQAEHNQGGVPVSEIWFPFSWCYVTSGRLPCIGMHTV